MKTPTCPDCGSPRPFDWADDSCPLCLMRMGLGSEGSADVAEPAEPDPDGDGPDPEDHQGSALTIVHPGPDPAIERDEAEPIDPDGRLRLLGEVARGGMGIVFRGRDAVLGRELAVKVLQSRHRDHPEMIRRFIEEARIAGQLQHPGMVPVHEFGRLGDGRPYFTMRLVKGRTLAVILEERPEPASGRPHLLATFLQIAQTVAYAHARGVIHLDLKPANIMVGKYGEVQVMDWGLARVLGRDPIRASGDPEEGTRAGRFMGTPEYMAPEQFVDEPAVLDERADVFALGVILFEILAGRSPDRDPIEASTALACEGVDPELVALARDCLAADRESRPRDAGMIARRLSDHLEGMQDRLRRADLERAEAQTRAAEEKKRRRLTAALAVLGIALAGVAAFSYVNWSRRDQARQATAAVVLREIEVLRDEAADPGGDPARWAAARSAAARAALILGDAPESSRKRAIELTTAIDQSWRGAVADRGMLDRIEIAFALADEGAFREADERLNAIFREAGLGLDAVDPAEVGRAVARRPRSVAQALAVALDVWAVVRRERESNLWERDVGPWQAPLQAARAAEPDPWRDRLRAALADRDREELARLAEADDLERRPAAGLWLLGRLLVWDHQTERAQRMLARAWRAHPDDYWINLDLSLFLSFAPPARPDLSFLYNTSCLSLRPDSAIVHLRRASLLADRDPVEAESEFRRALRIWHDYAYAHWCLADLLAGLGRWPEAADEYRLAVRLSPGRYEMARLKLAEALIRVGEPVPGDPEPSTRSGRCDRQYDVGLVRLSRGDGPGAIEALRRASGLAEPGTKQAAECSAALRQAEDRERLRAVLRGESRALDNHDRVELIRLCRLYDWAAGAARLYAEALAADPSMPPVRGEPPSLAAACHAARAGTVPTADDPPPDAADRARLRSQALAWLRTDLDAWTSHLAAGKPEGRRRAADYLRRYRTYTEFAAVRDPEALKALPEDERAAWAAFWADVAARTP